MTSELPAWFLACCDDGGAYARPLILRDGCAVATDRHVAVAIWADPGEAMCAPEIAEQMFSPLGDAATHEIEASDLLAFVGPPRAPVTCDKCAGGGQRPHMCDCALCDTEVEPCGCDGGRIPAPAEPFAAGGAVFDRTILARALVDLAPGAVRGALRSAPAPATGMVLTLDAPGRRVRLIERRQPAAGLHELTWMALR